MFETLQPFYDRFVDKIRSPYVVFLGMSIFLGLILRLWGIGYGLPYGFHPDETRQILDSIGMGARKSVIPLEFTYPALHKYLLVFAYGIYFTAGKTLGVFSNSIDFAFQFLSQQGPFYLIARLVSVVFGMGAIIVTYLTGRRFFGEDVGLVACALSSVMFHLVGHSQWGTPDIIMVFFSIGSFYYIFDALEGKGKNSLSLAGLFIGIAVSTKYHGVFLLAPFLIVLFIRSLKREMYGTSILRNMIEGGVSLTFGAAIGNLSWIFSTEETWKRFVELSQEKMGISSVSPYHYNIFSMIVWFCKEIVRQETTLGILLLIGIAYSIRRHDKKDFLFLAYVFFFLWITSTWGVRYLHVLVAGFPVLCLFGARSFVETFYMLFPGAGRIRMLSLLLLFLIVPVYNAADACIRKTYPDTRLVAKEWIEGNVPYGTTIALDWYEFCPPLRSNIPMYFHDSQRMAYYEDFVPEKVQQKYRDFINKEGYYEIIQIIHSTPEVNWPKDMPPEVAGKAGRVPICERLYKWFNFYSLDELIGKGVQYIVVSSFSYNHFLLDNDPLKSTGLFNPLVREDTLSNNRQAETYNDKDPHGLLYYLVKRARDFYLPLLRGELPAVKMIKIFEPEEHSLGPVIMIYKVDVR